MAKNVYKKKNPTKSPQKRFDIKIDFSFFKDPKFLLAAGLFLLFVGLCLLLSFGSYLFAGKADQSVVLGLSFGEILASGKEVENLLGLFGAWVSHLFIFRWFGVASFLIIPICFLSGYQLLYNKKLDYFSSIIKISIFFVFWITLILGYLVLISKRQTELLFISGGIGYEIAQALDSLAGWGTMVILVFALGVFIIYFFDITSISNLFGISFIKTEKDISTDEEEFVEQEDVIVTKPKKVHRPKVSPATETISNTKVTPPTPLSEPEVTPPLPSTPPIAEEETFEEIKEEVVVKEVPVPEEVVEEEPEQQEHVLHPEVGKAVGDVIEEDLSFEVSKGVVEEKVERPIQNYDPTLDLPKYKYPTLDLLEDRSKDKISVSREELENNKDSIIDTLRNYKIGISSIKATIGPTVTLYEIVPEAGVKISKIKNLEDDIALSLAALGIRIIAPIPGRGTVGIEVPNKRKEMVGIRSVLSTPKFLDSDKELPIAFGKTISNETFIVDLAKMPHILMAGATGQGKSVGINVILGSLLYKKHPSQLKLVLIDPKKVELSLYNKLEKHFLAKLPNDDDAIITDTKKAIHTLNSLCVEMDMRYDLLKDAYCRNIKEYNKKFIERKLNPEKGHRFLPYIVLIIDELADLMMTAGKEVETPIARLAQLARAIGIHIIVATQRPSVNVITGIIKANFPARLSFKVTSKIDSRTILDAGGANQLIGQGDMLFSQGADAIRVQCAFMDTPEVDEICDFIENQKGYGAPMYLPEFVDEKAVDSKKEDLSNKDALFNDAARIVVLHQQGSTSLVQRKLKLGYNRAGRLIDQLEAAGIVGPFEGSKARSVLVKDEQSLEQLLKSI